MTILDGINFISFWKDSFHLEFLFVSLFLEKILLAKMPTKGGMIEGLILMVAKH